MEPQNLLFTTQSSLKLCFIIAVTDILIAKQAYLWTTTTKLNVETICEMSLFCYLECLYTCTLLSCQDEADCSENHLSAPLLHFQRFHWRVRCRLITFAFLNGYFLKAALHIYQSRGHPWRIFTPINFSFASRSEEGRNSQPKTKPCSPWSFLLPRWVLPELGAIQRVFRRHMPTSLDAVPALLSPSLAVTFLLAEQVCDSGEIFKHFSQSPDEQNYG